MNLADMLSYTDIRELSRIASAYDCPCDSHSKNDLIQSILATVGRKDVFERFVGNLELTDIRFLNSLLFEQRSSHSMEELVALAQMTRFPDDEPNAPSDSRDTIVRFMKFGWLFHGYSPQTRFLYQVPSDLKKRFNDAFGRKLRETLRYTGDPAVYRDERELIVDDIDRFLRFVRERDVPLTAELFMYKRVLGQALEAMSVREAPVAKIGWRFGYGRRFKEYPNRFSLIYDYCFFAGYIREDAASLRLTEKGEDYLAAGRKEKLPDVYRFWLRLYKGPIPNIQSIAHWLKVLADDWVTAESLGDALCPLIRPYYYDSSRSIFETRIVQMMMHLGLIAVGDAEGAGHAVRLTQLGKSVVGAASKGDDSAIRLPNERNDVPKDRR